MTDLLSEVEAPSDAELISRVRGGDVAAYGQLFTRHKDAANRLARQLVRGSDSDDLVAEAFAKVLTALQSGGGPDVAFRAYLLTAVRRLHVDRVRSAQRVQTTDDLTPFDPGVPFKDTAVAGFETGAAAKAFASLPERWQLVLWHLEVEGQKPADIAPLLGMSANSVSALAYRAREGLRQAFLTMHISDLTETDCRWVNEHLGAFIRKGLSKRDSSKVQDHLDECRRCTAMYLELTEVNDNLAGIIAPLLLGAAATGYLASTGVGSAGLFGLLSRAKDLVGAHTGAASAAGVTVGVAAAAVAVFTLATGGSHPEAQAPDAPVGVTSTVPSPGAGAPSEIGPSPSPVLTAAPTIAPTTTLSPAAALFSPSVSLPASTESASPTGTATADATPTGTPTPDASPTDTSLTDAAPTDTVPTDTATAEPTDSTPTDVPVSLSGTTVDDDGVHLRGAGSPLPPSVTVLLTSASEGVRFANSGDCPVADGGREATCDLTPGGAGGRVPGTAVQADQTSFAAELPFNSLADEPDVDIDVAFEVPAGFSLDQGSDVITRFRHVLRHDVDVALSIPSAPLHPEAPGDVYRVPSSLSVTGTAQNRVLDVTYTASGGRFVGEDGTLQASLTRARGDDQPFSVVPDEPQHPDVRITASLASPLVDSDPVNDTAAAPLTPYDVSLSDLKADTPTADEDGNQRFTATVDDDGFPGDLVYTLIDDPANPNGSESPLEPTSVEGNTVTFTVRGDVDHTVAVRADLPTGFTDANADNNTSVADFAVPHDVDLALTVPGTPVRPGPNDVYAVSPSVTVTGAAARHVTTIGYTVAGGTFADGSTSTDRSRDDATPLQIIPLDPRAPEVTLIASVPPPLVDGNPTNDSVTVPLQPFDVSLSDLEADTPTADEDGIEEFHATVHDDGLAGVTYRLANPALGDSLVGEPRVDGDRLTVRVRSTASTAHDITIEAVPPLGFTDADPDDNTATAPWTPQPPLPLSTDLSLTPLTPANPVPDKRDGLYHLATTLHVFGDRPPSAILSLGDGTDARLESVRGCAVSLDRTQATCKAPANGTRLYLVLSAPTDRSTVVTIAVSAPPPYTEGDSEDNSQSTTLKPKPTHDVDVDVALSVGPGPLRPRAGDIYSVPTTMTLTGPAADQLSKVTYTVDGGLFVGGKPTISRPSGLTGPRFEVVPTDLANPRVSITASVPPDFNDTDPDNDTVAVPLKPYDVALTSVAPETPTADERGVQRFTATVTDDDLPARLSYELVDPAYGDSLKGRPMRAGDTVTFSVRSDATTAHPIRVRAVLPSGFTDVDPVNNVATVLWTPPAPDVPVDVRLLSLSPEVVRPDVDEQYTVTGMVSVDGRHASELTHIDYTLTGAEFSRSGDCTATTCILPATVTPTFHLRHFAGADTAPVTITAHVPEGFRDIDSENDSLSVVLKPYDVSLTGLVADTPAADAYGDQLFSARLDSDDVPEVSFELADGPADARLTHSWVHDGRVTFTVHSETDSPHPVAVRAVLPHGFTDAEPKNNTAAGATFNPRTVDMHLSARFASYDKDDKHGVIAVSVYDAPAGVLTFALTAHQPVDLTGSADCRLASDRQSASCRVSEPGTFTTTFGIDLPPGQAVSITVSADGDADPDESDNTVVLGKP